VRSAAAAASVGSAVTFYEQMAQESSGSTGCILLPISYTYTSLETKLDFLMAGHCQTAKVCFVGGFFRQLAAIVVVPHHDRPRQ
jgi:hypothetical protein